jgi:trigger factor
LKITTESLENHQIGLTIEVDEERTQQAMRRVARRIAKQTNIPGYRKGKAPYDVVVRRFGEDTIRGEAADVLTQEIYREAVEQEEIDLHAAGVLDDVTLNPITFRFTIPLRPTVSLGDYRDYRLDPPQVEVSQEDVQQTLETIREQHALLESVDRPAALSDVVTIDLAGQTVDDVVFIKEDGVRIVLDAARTDPAPGFAEAVVGMKADEERTFTLTLSDGFHRKELRGQEAEFTVKLTEIHERILPALDDDLARTVGNFDSFEELEERVRGQLQQTARGKADEEYVAQVMESTLEQAQVEYPPAMLKESLDETVEGFKRALKQESRLSLEDYLRIQGTTMDQVREDLKPQAAARLKRALVLGEIVHLEGVEADEQEGSAHSETVSAAWGDRAAAARASLDSDEPRRAMRSRLLGDKAVQRLVAIAKGEVEETGRQGDGETE